MSKNDALQTPAQSDSTGSSHHGSGLPPPPSTSAASSKPSPGALKRVRAELRAVLRDPLPGAFVIEDPGGNVMRIHVLITGSEGTPYQGGLFYFLFDFPPTYPYLPPTVQLITTGGGSVRFGPNLYANGKVCLSILNTYTGPKWSPTMSLSTVILSIQSIMNETPFCNEPGFETPKNPRDVGDYNNIIEHETLRVAVCETLEDTSYSRLLPPSFRELAAEIFPSYVEHFQEMCTRRARQDGGNMRDPFGMERGRFQWRALGERLRKLVEAMPPEEPDEAEGESEKVQT